VPIPRRLDRTPPERDATRVNERIRVPEVRLVGDDGEQIGVLKRDDALEYARERDLDLVEVAADAKPPVCRVLDYSKYKYEQEQKAKAARKHQQQTNVREIKLRPKIAIHDYETKRGHVERFLRGQDKVKVTIMFRGREQSHPERGRDLLKRLADDVAELGTVEQRPLQEGRNMHMLLGPVKPKQEQAQESKSPDVAETTATEGSGNSQPAEPKQEADSKPKPAAKAKAKPPAKAKAAAKSKPKQAAKSS
jgi:translation initiation factor IF-3